MNLSIPGHHPKEKKKNRKLSAPDLTLWDQEKAQKLKNFLLRGSKKVVLF